MLSSIHSVAARVGVHRLQPVRQRGEALERLGQRRQRQAGRLDRGDRGGDVLGVVAAPQRDLLGEAPIDHDGQPPRSPSGRTAARTPAARRSAACRRGTAPRCRASRCARGRGWSAPRPRGRRQIGDLVARELAARPTSSGSRSSRSITGPADVAGELDRRDAGLSRCAITVAVVLLPLVPVTPITCRPPRSASHRPVAVVTGVPARDRLLDQRLVDRDAGRAHEHVGLREHGTRLGLGRGVVDRRR